MTFFVKITNTSGATVSGLASNKTLIVDSSRVTITLDGTDIMSGGTTSTSGSTGPRPNKILSCTLTAGSGGTTTTTNTETYTGTAGAYTGSTSTGTSTAPSADLNFTASSTLSIQLGKLDARGYFVATLVS